MIEKKKLNTELTRSRSPLLKSLTLAYLSKLATELMPGTLVALEKTLAPLFAGAAVAAGDCNSIQ